MVTAMAFAGNLNFNPLVDPIKLPDGSDFYFSPPTGQSVPEKGYNRTLEYYCPPPKTGSAVELAVDPGSERIQLLQPFEAWKGNDDQDVDLLIKVRGKCSMFIPCHRLLRRHPLSEA